jgi:hypothetical protein
MNIKKFFNSQQKFITKKFGELAANRANYGWVTSNDSYLSKVYGEEGKFNTAIVTTFLDEDGRIAHQINGY